MLFQVRKLFYHLTNEKYIVSSEGQPEVGLAQGEQITTLTVWFLANSGDPNDPVDKLRRTYTWQGASLTTGSLLSSPTTGTGLKGRGGQELTIGRVPICPMSQHSIERYCLRLQLHHVLRAMGYEDLTTVDEEVHPTFLAAAMSSGFLEADAENEQDNVESCTLQIW